MKKIFFSIVISLMVSYGGMQILDRNIKENWELNLNYEHISRLLNVDYEMIIDITKSNHDSKFSKFVNVLSSNISVPGKLNPCSKIRSSSKVPNIILTDDRASIQIVMSHENKKLIFECEKYIDREMNLFSRNSKLLLSKLLTYKIERENPKEPEREYNEKKIYELLFQEIMRHENKKELELEDIKNLTTSLMLIDMVSPKEAKSEIFVNNNKINKLQIVTKSSRYITREENNKTSLMLSLFIISLSILIFTFNFNQLKSKNFNKINKIFRLLLK